MSYKGLILDFGGVVTTDFYGALDAFSDRAGLGDRAFVRALRENTEGRDALAAVESGAMPQREFESPWAGCPEWTTTACSPAP